MKQGNIDDLKSAVQNLKKSASQNGNGDYNHNNKREPKAFLQSVLRCVEEADANAEKALSEMFEFELKSVTTVASGNAEPTVDSELMRELQVRYPKGRTDLKYLSIIVESVK